MDADTVKRRIALEVQDQFEGKLREAKRQTSVVEEELEAASERWRGERKRLNAEIDRLEAALSETKATVKKLPPSKGPHANGDGNPTDPAVIAAAEERFRKASVEWEGERSKLQSEIGRLERSVAEILERSNNPVRSLQAIQQKLETDLQDAVGARKRIEDEMERARGLWAEERLKMAGELFRIRRGDTRETSDSNSSELQRAQAASNSSELQRAQAASNSNELQRAQAELDTTRHQLEEARAALKAGQAAPPGAGNASMLQELSQQKTDLARELSRATTLLAEERQVSENTNAELRKVREELQGARTERGHLQQRPLDGGNATRAEILAQVTEEYSARIDAIVKEKAALAGRLESADTLLNEERQRGAGAGEELRRARLEIQQLERRLAESAGTMSSDGREQLQAQFAAQAQDLAEKNSGLAGRLESAGLLLEEERQRNAALGAELNRARTETQQLERRLAENRDAVSAEVVEQLRAQYTAKLQEIAQEKTTLARELEAASASFEQERQRFAAVAPSVSASAVDGPTLEREMARVEEAIAEITRFIDDPAAQLAMVIRKNVERAELDSYLKGIHFASGQRAKK